GRRGGHCGFRYSGREARQAALGLPGRTSGHGRFLQIARSPRTNTTAARYRNTPAETRANARVNGFPSEPLSAPAPYAIIAAQVSPAAANPAAKGSSVPRSPPVVLSPKDAITLPPTAANHRMAVG